MAYATHQAEINAPRPDGSSMREHLEAVLARGASARGYDKATERLNGPSLPDSLAYLWGWYLELRSAQRSGVNGMEPIGFGDIRDWAELTGRSPQPFDVKSLIAMDAVVRRAMRPAQPAQPPARPVSDG